MPRPTFLGVHAPVMSETSSARSLIGRKDPAPFLEIPILDERVKNPTSSSPTSLSTHTNPMMAEDPFADTTENVFVFDDRLPAEQLTRMSKTHHSGASGSPSSSTFRQVCNLLF
jgi:hypothetical protein